MAVCPLCDGDGYYVVGTHKVVACNHKTRELRWIKDDKGDYRAAGLIIAWMVYPCGPYSLWWDRNDPYATKQLFNGTLEECQKEALKYL